MRTAPTTRHDRKPLEMVGEAVDLSVGLGILLLPLLTWAVPGVVLMLVLPVLLLALVAAVPVAIVAALVAPVYLLAGRRSRAA